MFIYKYHGGPNDGETLTLPNEINCQWWNVPKPSAPLKNPWNEAKPPSATVAGSLTYEVHGYKLVFIEEQVPKTDNEVWQLLWNVILQYPMTCTITNINGSLIYTVWRLGDVRTYHVFDMQLLANFNDPEAMIHDELDKLKELFIKELKGLK